MTNNEILFKAVEENNFETVKFLVENLKNIDISAAICNAADKGYFEIVEFLVEKGADIHTFSDMSLRYAARNGHFNVVEFLVKNGANIHTWNDEALSYAAYNGHFGIVKFLVENGANIYARNPLYWATKNGHTKVVDYLKSVFKKDRKIIITGTDFNMSQYANKIDLSSCLNYKDTNTSVKQSIANTTKKRIYLANPYGFSTQAKQELLPPIIAQLETLGLEVWEPFERNNQEAISGALGWAYRVGQKDLSDVYECDAVFAIVNGTPPDEGVMVELGAAIALKKPTFLFRDDFRRCTDSEDYPLNLMLFTGLPQNNWKDFYYSSVNEITNENKALAKWAIE